MHHLYACAGKVVEKRRNYGRWVAGVLQRGMDQVHPEHCKHAQVGSPLMHVQKMDVDAIYRRHI